MYKKFLEYTSFHIITLGIVCLLLFSGCHNRVQYPSEIPSKKTVTFSENYWFFGIMGEANYELYEYCRHGRVYEVDARSSVPQAFLGILTLGIYTPRTVDVTCSGKTNESSDNAEEMVTPESKEDEKIDIPITERENKKSQKKSKQKILKKKKKGTPFDEH